VIAAAKEGATALDRPWIGMHTQPVTGEIAEALGLDRPAGLLVDQLHPASSFARAGVASGDILLSLDGEPLTIPGARRPGQVVAIDLAALIN